MWSSNHQQNGFQAICAFFSRRRLSNSIRPSLVRSRIKRKRRSFCSGDRRKCTTHQFWQLRVAGFKIGVCKIDFPIHATRIPAKSELFSSRARFTSAFKQPTQTRGIVAACSRKTRDPRAKPEHNGLPIGELERRRNSRFERRFFCWSAHSKFVH